MQYLVIKGGLGNQMFQYALYLALKQSGHKLKLDTSLYSFLSMHNGYELPEVFTLDGKKDDSGNYLRKLYVRPWVKYKDKVFNYFGFEDKVELGYQQDVFSTRKLIIDGYFQSELYFKDIAPLVKKTFTFKGIDERNAEMASIISSCSSVSMHIRRGDYKKYGVKLMEADYYSKAVNFIKSKVDNPVFYIFSDDIIEAEIIAKKNDISYQIIKGNNGKDSYKDMFLISRCRHHIIANSSFSWWGAWLGDWKDKIVISPEWFKDFACRNWFSLK